MNDFVNKTEIIHNRIFRHRLDQNKENYKGWQAESIKGIKNITARIEELLRNNHRVTGGYYATSVRGFHEYFIFFK